MMNRNTIMSMAHCNQCDFDWNTRVKSPSCCPRCKRYDWSEHKKYQGGSSEASTPRGGDAHTRKAGNQRGVQEVGSIVIPQVESDVSIKTECPWCHESKQVIVWGTGHRCPSC